MIPHVKNTATKINRYLASKFVSVKVKKSEDGKEIFTTIFYSSSIVFCLINEVLCNIFPSMIIKITGKTLETTEIVSVNKLTSHALQ